MKKFFCFIAVAAVMTVAMTLSSCSHDDYYYSPEKVEKAVNDNYAASFEKAFGKVGPNVDWGFSSKGASARAFTRAKSDYADYKGNIQPTLDPPFPSSDCDASNFLSAAPEGVVSLPTWGGGPNSYLVEGAYEKVSTSAGASKIYVKGTVDLSANDTNAEAPRFAPDYRSEIYLLKGSKLILGEVSAINFNVAAIYIAAGASLETAGVLKANNSTKIYNHGTITVGTFEPNTSSFLYNVGTLTAESVTAESNPTRIVNDGTINCASVTVKAGAVQNNAEWNVTGTTRIESNNSGWVNNGHWTTYDYAYIGGSQNVINNCFLEVENDFEMNISSKVGSFKIDAGGGVLTKNFYGGRDSSTGAISGPFKIEMGANAVFVVDETAQFESGRSEIDNDKYAYGIFGPSSTGTGYAVFQAKNIVRAASLSETWGAVTYRGNLYVSAEQHFAQGNDGYDAHKFIIEQDGFSISDNIYAAGFKNGKPNIKIPATPCNPGFNDALYRVIAEDLSASESSDFDFNDVVFDVVKAEGDKTTLKLICAGGVLPLTIQGKEVHGLFGKTAKANGEYPMINTGAGPELDPVTFEIDGEYTTPEEINDIEIKVLKNNVWMELEATRGKAACKILVDDTFVPVEERRNIADENNNFTNYVQGKFVDDFWWK